MSGIVIAYHLMFGAVPEVFERIHWKVRLAYYQSIGAKCGVDCQSNGCRDMFWTKVYLEDGSMVHGCAAVLKGTKNILGVK